MVIITAVGNMPPPVRILFLTEASATKAMSTHPTEGLFKQPDDYYPVVVECASVSELDKCVADDPDVEKQLLIDKETRRCYLTAIGFPGRIRYTGSGEEDEKVIDILVKTEDRSIIYYTEVNDSVRI